MKYPTKLCVNEFNRKMTCVRFDGKRALNNSYLATSEYMNTLIIE